MDLFLFLKGTLTILLHLYRWKFPWWKSMRQLPPEGRCQQLLLLMCQEAQYQRMKLFHNLTEIAVHVLCVSISFKKANLFADCWHVGTCSIVVAGKI